MAIVVVKKVVSIGKPIAVTGEAPSADRSASFMDDGETGTFYADYDGLPERYQEGGTLDALHIYDVDEIRTRQTKTKVAIVWSDDSAKAALLLDGHVHAVLDFAAKRGYCRTGLPRPSGQWKAPSHDWDETAADFLK
jgi:hypothetical protein